MHFKRGKPKAARAGCLPTLAPHVYEVAASDVRLEPAPPSVLSRLADAERRIERLEKAIGVK
jgi:hypothetical protein